MRASVLTKLSDETLVKTNVPTNLSEQALVETSALATTSTLTKTSVLAKWSDEALMIDFKNSGEDYCFKLLVDRYKGKLYSVAFGLLGDAYEAEEIVQEAFIRVWRNCHNFRSNATFAAWTFSIIQNLCKDIWRTRRRKQGYEAIFFSPWSVHEHEEAAKGYTRTISQMSNASREPGKEAEYTELKAFIAVCLEQLPANQKEVVVLRDLQGHSYKNIASLTGVSIGTVRSRLFYARQKLKEIMK